MSEQKPPPERARKPSPARAPRSQPPRSRQELDDMLDEALEETFPASDPIELSSRTA